MATTSTYQFNPAASALTLTAYGRIGIRRAELTTQHLTDAETESNLLQVELSSRIPNLWRQEIYTITMVEGTAVYDLPTRTVGIRDAYLTTTLNGVSTDRVVWPFSTFEYDAQPNKTLQAPPTAYWVAKTMSPTITMWPVPDGEATYTLNLRLMTQMQDVSIVSGTTLDMPYRWLDVYVAGLAYRLARIYAPDREMARKADYAEAWNNAAQEDTEDNTSLYVLPDFTSYYKS